MLAAWKLGGYERQHGQAPEADDLIAPNRDGNHRNPNQAIACFHLDLKALGLRKRRQHDCRRTFTSLARGDGAPGELVNWITHGPSGSINDAYTSMPWKTLCDAVSKLVLELRAGKLLKLKRAVAVNECDTECDTRPSDMKKPPSLIDLEATFVMPKKGFEGEETGRPSQIVEGKGPDSNESATPSSEHSRPSTETGVTVSQLEVFPPPNIDATAVSAMLSEALTAWLRAPDSAALMSRLREILRMVGGTRGV